MQKNRDSKQLSNRGRRHARTPQQHGERANVAAEQNNQFLGTGWGFPPTFSTGVYSVDMVSGELDIKQSLLVLLQTQLGERVMEPGFGCELMAQAFANMTTGFSTDLSHYLLTAMVNWESRITVDNITISADANVVGRVQIEIDYIIRMTNVRDNLVYPFYLLEATLPNRLT